MTAVIASVADYLMNSLWLVPALFGVAWLLALAARRVGPQLEHRIWVAAVLLQALLPACSAPRLAAAVGRAVHRLMMHPHADGGTVTVMLGEVRPLGYGLHSGPGLRIALSLYLLATAYMITRFVWQWLRLRRLTIHMEHLAMREQDAALVEACCNRWHIRSVQLATSADVAGPLTFGVRKPLLLLPTNFAQTAPAARMRATLAHELAHIGRRDFAKQLLYRCLLLPVAYHPLCWVTLARVVETREMVCDALAVEILGDRKQFVQSLLEIASSLIGSRNRLSHAIGMFDANRFERRILMLHRNEVKAPRHLRVGVVALSAVAALTTCASAVALRLHVDAPAGSTIAAADDPVRVQSGVMAGQIVSKVQPKYPQEAKKARVQGAVILKAIIGKDGSVENLQVASGPEELRASALDAVRQWKYKPYLLNGEPTEVDTTITINYSMGEESPAAATDLKVEGVTAPTLIRRVDVQYPEAARQAKIGGEVMVALKVGESGTVSDVDAISGPEELRAAATDAVKQYVFQPATLHGTPVAVSLRVAVDFKVFD